MKPSGPVAFALLIGLAAGSWWLAQGGGDEGQAEQAPPATQPGYYLRDATLEQTDADGRLTMRAHAARGAQQGEQGPVHLEQVEVHYFPQPGQDWLMTSAAGSMPPAGRVVEFEGDVRLRAAAAAAATGAVVRTEHLALDVDSTLATTEDPVRIEFGPHAVVARGLRADLKHETLRLESAVNGTFTR
ncbi:MAG TPA: LPS export ABC transporter periplasmic protein LptC [Steroidobacteraceae bacterium]|nr:LPS export ABC transporter periplasmic protein LptC [Steroidobacteraceae bacterium]